MYRVYDQARVLLFQATDHELLTYQAELKHSYRVTAPSKTTLPVLVFPSWPGQRAVEYHRQTGGHWVRSLEYGLYAVFPSQKHLDTYRYLYPSQGSLPPDLLIRPLLDIDGQLTVSQFFVHYHPAEGLEARLFGPRGRALAARYQTWIKVLFILVNEYKVSNPSRGRDLWLAFSKQCPEKYDYSRADALWKATQPQPHGLTLGSLIYLTRD